MSNLNRFIEAQKRDYNLALREIQKGRKKSHWIWYIFPQLKGLGKSYESEYYGIESIEEAKEYVGNEYLYNNLIRITEELLDLDADSINDIMDYPDDKKLCSSMTLFYIATKNDLFKNVIRKYFGGQFDQTTIDMIDTKLVWYVCYGSNLCLERFMCYLTGNGCDQYNLKKDAGRAFYDQTPPRESRTITIPYKIFFAGHSPWWEGKGVAYLDYESKGDTIGRAYLITESQYKHVWEHEGLGYRHKIILDSIDGIPAYSFTCELENRCPNNEPGETYLKCIKNGLIECGLSEEKALDYIESIRNNKCDKA